MVTFVKGLLSAFTPERIEDLPESPERMARSSLLSVLLDAETLPLDDPLPPGPGKSILGMLLSSETLPEDPPDRGSRHHRGLLGWLVAREELGQEPVPPAGDGANRKGGPAAR